MPSALPRVAALCLTSTLLIAAAAQGQRFDISFPASARATPVRGRVFVIVTRNASREPRLQLNQVDGVPFFGRDVDQLAPGQSVSITITDSGYPVNTLRDIPAGDYYVQAVVNVYSEFRRADGHTVWMHDDQWEGQKWERSPGNLYSKVQRLHLDARSGYDIKLVADQVIPPVVVPADTKWVQRIKFQSPSLTKFWGRPVYLGATVLLPKNFEASSQTFPVLYEQGHFSLNPPLNFREGTSLYDAWTSDSFPRMLVVAFQHPNPYFDDSYAVNSANVGPYGDAIMRELIPEIEKRFHARSEGKWRALAGGSTGGWEALALQVFHPDDFGGAWVYCPDPVTFHAYEGVDIYDDDNAYFKRHEWYTVPTPNIRDTLGHVLLTVQQKNAFENANDRHGRSGHQLDIWSAVFSPVGTDGYYQPLVDRRTGAIDKKVADYWREHYDLMDIMRRDWSTLGPKLQGKLHFYVGDMDTYYLDVGVVMMQSFLKTTTNPKSDATFTYGRRKPHCYSGEETQAQRLVEIAKALGW